MNIDMDLSSVMSATVSAGETVSPFAVHSWPELVPDALATFHQHKCVVISVNTGMTTLRDQPRQHIRRALQDLVSKAFTIPQESVQITGSAGQALSLRINASTSDSHSLQDELILGVSISHEPGLSIAAVSFHKNIGIDLMCVDFSLDWHNVAQLYLGDEVYRKIAGQAVQLQALLFAQEWTKHEARLKSQGMVLSEWRPDLAAQLTNCRTMSLDLPSGYVGTIAF